MRFEMDFRRIILTIFISVSAAGVASAQAMDKDHLSVTAYARDSHFLDALNIYGNLIETYDCATAGVLIGVNTKPSDNNYYAWAYNLPHYGLGISYSNMSSLKCRPESHSRLGDAYTFFGYAHFDLVKNRHFSFGPHFEFGASYVTKQWNAVENPRNYYVGTPVLVMVGAGLEASCHITPKWELGVNAILTHRSNGMLKVPNYGLNEIAIGGFLRYDLEDKYLGTRGDRPELPEYKKWIYDVYISAGVHSCDAERHVYEDYVLKPGDKNEWSSFRSWIRTNIGVTVSYRYHPLFATGIGVDVSYTENWRRLGEYYELKYGEPVNTCPVYVGAYIQQSLFYKNVEIAVGLGVYIFKQLGIEDSTWNYQRTLIRYHIPQADDIFFGFAMRAHQFDRSDTLEFSFGKRF